MWDKRFYNGRLDPLADVLDLSRVRGALLGSVSASAPWGLELPHSGGASLHAVTSGSLWLEVEGEDVRQIMPGDVLLFPAGTTHRLVSEPGIGCQRWNAEMKEERMSPAGELLLDGAGATSTFVCAGYDYDLEIAQLILVWLPQVLHVRADPVNARSVASLVELLAGEVGAPNAGSRAASARLIDLLLIEAIRRWIELGAESEAGSWLTAMRDPMIATVLGLLHSRTSEPWTLETLAAEVHVSRATLARRFNEAVGESPIAYLTRWRMSVALQRLKHSDDTVEAIAREVGYRSEYAFNRAFSRRCGQPPGRYRRALRAA
jgi:AraC-like DNA-binding protein